MNPIVRVRRGLIAGLVTVATLLAVAPVTSAAPRTFTLDLAARADFVAQTNNVQCVGASMQMMLNMIEPGRDRTAKTQLRLQKLARKWSGSRPDGSERRGASVAGWMQGLNLEGAGPYKLAGADSIKEALALAATAMRLTDKPVGLLVWRGRHAWVMSGFKATADPARTDEFRVTAAIVEDPLYPHGSSVWGKSPSPGQALTPAQLGKQFVKRRTNSAWNAVQPWSRDLAGKYVLVLPYKPFTMWSPAHVL